MATGTSWVLDRATVCTLTHVDATLPLPISGVSDSWACVEAAHRRIDLRSHVIIDSACATARIGG
jgi:hypothetical protein